MVAAWTNCASDTHFDGGGGATTLAATCATSRVSVYKEKFTRQSFRFIFADSSRTLTGAILCTECELEVDFGVIILFVDSRFVTHARSAGRAVIVVDARVNMLIALCVEYKWVCAR